MNLAHRYEDDDYEPDVLKFKQIWNQMGQINKENHNHNPPHPEPSKSKTKSSHNASEQPRRSKKQTVISEKNVIRNPKRNNEEVIEIVTKPEGGHSSSLNNQRNFIKRNEYVQSANSPTLQN